MHADWAVKCAITCFLHTNISFAHTEWVSVGMLQAHCLKASWKNCCGGKCSNYYRQCKNSHSPYIANLIADVHFQNMRFAGVTYPRMKTWSQWALHLLKLSFLLWDIMQLCPKNMSTVVHLILHVPQLCTHMGNCPHKWSQLFASDYLICMCNYSNHACKLTMQMYAHFPCL